MPKQVVIPLGSTSGQIADTLSRLKYPVFHIPFNITGQHHEYEEWYDRNREKTLTELKPFLADAENILVIVDDSHETGAVLALLEDLRNLPVTVLQYCKGRNTSHIGRTIERILYHVLIQKARSGKHLHMVVSEDNMEQIWGNIWAVGVNSRYCEIVAKLYNEWNYLSHLEPKLTRTNSTASDADYLQRVAFANVATLCVFSIENEAVTIRPLFTLDSPTFFSYFINMPGEGDQLPASANTLQTYAERFSDGALHVNFYDVPEMKMVRLGIIQTTNAPDVAVQ
jgi:hypothetical protein